MVGVVPRNPVMNLLAVMLCLVRMVYYNDHGDSCTL
jgi:hypothetical protein